ncbi:hypothetical protein tinsulaeT_03990 [Thalassotalea insulae]|uniref:DUF2884 family protein n=1 Tax=Thalassotalea insulae TaxID=2056778 RepID=A0ABQ6GP26_9GAMM|nr:DUF2884 family protein [Thalassotalea insulae]GLX77059.1 hypothetical protein tinsulaeT_03990 [Thalassotalea insulae]
MTAKNILLKTRALLPIFSLLALPLAHAEQCDININYGVVIDPVHIRVLEQGITYIQINHDNQLFIQGREVPLSSSQQATLSQYASDIRQQFPEIVSLAIEGVDVGLKAINKVIAGVTGENSSSHQKLQKKFEQLKWQLRMRLNQSAENFYIAPQEFDDFGEMFADQFEKEIESLITESIGSILFTVGEAIENHERAKEQEPGYSFEQRIEQMGSELELEMSSKVNALEAQADKFCDKLKEINGIEAQLIQQIPELAGFDLISSSD